MFIAGAILLRGCGHGKAVGNELSFLLHELPAWVVPVSCRLYYTA